MRRRGRVMYVTQDVDVEIDFEDIRTYVSEYASEDELKLLAKDLEENYLTSYNVEVKTLEDELKMKILMELFKKYSLTDLESKVNSL